MNKEISYRSRLLFSVALNIAFTVGSIVLFHPFWEEDDDIWIALITEGAFGHNDPHVLFSSIIYGHIVCRLQQILSTVRWHAILEYLLPFVMSVVFIFVLSKNRDGKILSLIFYLPLFTRSVLHCSSRRFPFLLL